VVLGDPALLDLGDLRAQTLVQCHARHISEGACLIERLTAWHTREADAGIDAAS